MAPDDDGSPGHRELATLLDEAGKAVAALGVPQPPVERVDATIDRLAALGQALGRHFDLEEADDGFFAHVFERAPHLARELDRIRSQHAPLRERVAELVEAANWAGTNAAAWGRVDELLGQLTRDLRRHESAEDVVAADALMVDEGGSG